MDDILITGARVEAIEEFKSRMGKRFEMTNLGKLSYYLGIKVKLGENCIEIKQSGYAKRILDKAGMGDCNPAKFPMDSKEQITKDEQGKTEILLCLKAWRGSSLSGKYAS